MDVKQAVDVLNQISSLAAESARDSEVLSLRFKEAETLLKRATKKSEQATEALSSWRLLRYFQLRRQERRFLAQALALMEVPKEISHRSEATVVTAKNLRTRYGPSD